ncbi:MAG: hypothetical protein F4X04_05875 [Holophagales bacterium]|nr:hypothetical protein [Holophagales bacterium]MYD21749.1 hypothetical protein [Holophagales bacterium]
MKRNKRAIRVEIAEDILEGVFAECDRYDHEETGGRVVGHFTQERGALVVRPTALIDPGPNARRSRTSFFQDGEYQTRVFRRLEAKDPAIEHLGNWHTHHVNGYPQLSGGDVETYRRIVNHERHNLDFFYALLVTQRHEGREGLKRYSVRHYVLFRGEAAVHEVSPQSVRVTSRSGQVAKVAEPSGCLASGGRPEGDGSGGRLAVRARDQFILEVLCPSMEPRRSSRTGTFFWKGRAQLIDGSEVDVRVVEVQIGDGPVYYPVVADASAAVAKLCEAPFPSAAEAVHALESHLNRELYEGAARGR